MGIQEIVENPQPESQPAGVAHIRVQKPRPIGKAILGPTEYVFGRKAWSMIWTAICLGGYKSPSPSEQFFRPFFGPQRGKISIPNLILLLCFHPPFPQFQFSSI